MSQGQYIQAGVQVEAGLELREMLRPLIQKIVHSRPSAQRTDSKASVGTVFATVLNVFTRQ